MLITLLDAKLDAIQEERGNMCEHFFLGLELKTWSDFGGLALPITIFAIIFTARQVVEAARLRKMETVSRLHEILGTKEKRDARARIHSLCITGIPFCEMELKDKVEIESAIVAFDQFAFFASMAELSNSELAEIAGDVVMGNYPVLSSYFSDIRKFSNMQNKGKPFRALYTIIRQHNDQVRPRQQKLSKLISPLTATTCMVALEIAKRDTEQKIQAVIRMGESTDQLERILLDLRVASAEIG